MSVPVDEVAAGVASMSTGDDQPSETSNAGGEQIVTPWDVAGGADGKIDYAKLVNEFGCATIDDALIARIERATGRARLPSPPRHVLRPSRARPDRHRVREQEKFYLYTGRGPSSEALHLGHLIPFRFTKWLQEAFKVPSSSSSPTTKFL